MTVDPVDRGYELLAQGRAEEALAISAPLAKARDASHEALALHSSALNAAHRLEEALAYNRKAAGRFPGSATAWHNLAATLIDLGRGSEALEALATGFSAGLDSPASYLIKARAHVACGEPENAEAAYREARRRAPAEAGVAFELSDFLWMARGDMAAAQAVLDAAFHTGAPPAPLLAAKAKLFSSDGDFQGAATLLARAAEHLPDDPQIIIAAAQAALEADRLDEADRLSDHGLKLAPGTTEAVIQRTIVQLALGRAQEALAGIRPLYDRLSEDQPVLAWTATAARLAGDPLYHFLCDYDSMVGVYEVEPPPGFGSREQFLAELAAALDRHHVMKEHPAGQSLRHGTQTTYLLTGSQEPAVSAFFAALDVPVRAHLARLGSGADPVRRRNRGGYRIVGAWSVRLRPGGFHLDHLHHQGWLSSAFYVETPNTALESEGREGWLRLGHPPTPTRPELPSERFVRPEPGRLVLFPSYMWHGTVPFRTDERRTTIAFDLLPG